MPRSVTCVGLFLRSYLLPIGAFRRCTTSTARCHICTRVLRRPLPHLTYSTLRMAATKNPTLDGHKVLVSMSSPPDDESIKSIQSKFPALKIQWHQTTKGKVPPEYYSDTTVLMTWNSLPTPEQAPKLELIQLSSAGSNHCWESPLFADPKIKFCTANGIHPPQITEWVFSTFLLFQHKLPKYLALQDAGSWDMDATVGVGESEIEDTVRQRMGILGYGAIGRQCARVAKAFGMDVVVYTMRERSTPSARCDDSYVVPGTGDPEGLLPSEWFHGTSKESLNDFLARDLDILVICLPQTSLTKGMIAKEQFEILSKKKTFISNVARGPIVNTEDLIKALEKGLIRGAALDVTDPEPLPKDHPLWKAPNVIVTPHISFQSKHRMRRLMEVLEVNLQRLSEGVSLVNLVDKEVGF